MFWADFVDSTPEGVLGQLGPELERTAARAQALIERPDERNLFLRITLRSASNAPIDDQRLSGDETSTIA